MHDLLSPPPKPKKSKTTEPFKFELPLEKPMCDNTTKFSKWIKKKKPKLANQILQCAAHLTGIAWQKRSHTKHFDNQATYKKFYKLVVRCLRCSSTALAIILQRKIVEWLRARHEPRAANWFEEYWTGDRGNYMLAHAEVGGCNNNCGTEGGWNGVKKEVCGTAGSTTSLAVRSVVPSILRFLTNKSRELASFQRRDTRERLKTSSAMFTFPSLPVPTKEEWDHMERLRQNILELITVFAPAAVKTEWNVLIQDVVQAAEEDGVADKSAHAQITAFYQKKPTAKPPPRRSITHVIMPSTSLLNRIDPERTMTAAQSLAAMDEDLARFDGMLANPVVFDAVRPDLDAEDYIALHESFYLLEPLGERWGKWVTWKCMCETFFGNGVCGHSTLMALLYDSSLEFPKEWSKQPLPSNAKTSKRPTAWAEEFEEEEGPSRSGRWVMHERELIVTKTRKVCLADSVSLPCLISSLFTGSSRYRNGG